MRNQPIVLFEPKIPIERHAIVETTFSIGILV